jgi:hypothetical protein
MKFDPIGMGGTSVTGSEEECICELGGTGCGTWVRRNVCLCAFDGCGCGRGRPGAGPI